ncbi:microtubule-associated serine/threonine-protein kinase 4-like, partial [Tropilaelaps mercedesae]
VLPHPSFSTAPNASDERAQNQSEARSTAQTEPDAVVRPDSADPLSIETTQSSGPMQTSYDSFNQENAEISSRAGTEISTRIAPDNAGREAPDNAGRTGFPGESPSPGPSVNDVVVSIGKSRALRPPLSVLDKEERGTAKVSAKGSPHLKTQTIEMTPPLAAAVSTQTPKQLGKVASYGRTARATGAAVRAKTPALASHYKNSSTPPTMPAMRDLSSTAAGPTTQMNLRSKTLVDTNQDVPNAPSFMIHRVLAHEYFLTESACTIEDEHGVAHKVNKKAVFAKVRKEAERIVAKAEYLLECFVKQERKIKPSRTPREHFAMEQTCRTAFELFFRVRKSRLGCDDIREGIENLAFLFDYLVNDSPTVAGASFVFVLYLANLLRRLVMIMEEIAPLLEKGSGIATTDWTALRIHYKNEEDQLRARKEQPLAIPPMSLITGEPSNLIITPGCRLKMIDFDTVKICIGMFSKKRLKSFFRRTYTEFNDRETAGTPNFFPPEFIRCSPYGRAVDWWAVGVTAYEMCFGKTPFRGENDEELETAIQTVNYKFPVKGPRGKYYLEFKDLVARLIKKRASERLCSRRYSDFLAHPFFDGLDLTALEDGSHFVDYEGITNLMQPSGEHPDEFSPKISEELQTSRSEYLEPEKMKDSTEHCPLYTFVSPAFQAAVRKALREEQLSYEDAQEAPELGIVNPPIHEAKAYKFNAYMR